MNTSEKTPVRRNQTACEACRATKIRCQPSEQPGVCRKCLESKRECVSRTGPRIRRPRRPKIVLEEGQPPAPHPPLSGPSRTFSINFEVAAQAEADDSFEILKDTHAEMLDQLFPPEESAPSPYALTGGSQHGTRGATMPLTPPGSTSQHSQSIENLHGKPQFNLDSAEGLLKAFRGMLDNYPVLVLDDGATVPKLAASKPFVLLAILSAASGNRTLQGHSLYDEEFRKVLALKFVAGGERTLELLQGILIYCAWYPFHLRPKNKQVYHYIRMAADLVKDLDLDQETQLGDPVTGEAITEQQLDHIRAYLCYTYAASSFVVAWRKYRDLASAFTPWTSTCCDVLDTHGTYNGDRILAAMVRFSAIVNDAVGATHDRGPHITDQQTRLLLLGLETQAAQLRSRLTPAVSALPHIRLTCFFIDCYLCGGSILQFPKPRDPIAAGTLPPDPLKLQSCAQTLRLALDYALALEPSVFSSFTGVDWSRLVLTIILAFHLSFPLVECPSHDPATARGVLQVGDFLTKMSSSNLTPASNGLDVLSASKVVLGVVNNKYERKLRTSEAKRAGCPMIDGSMDDYLALWDPAFNVDALNVMGSSGDAPSAAADSAETGDGRKMPVFHDLWATMTMGWANEDPTGGQW